MRRLWPSFVCLLVLALVGSRAPNRSPQQQLLQAWEQNLMRDQETCYLCSANIGYVTEETLFLDAVVNSFSEIRTVPAYISVCYDCATRHGWPLPHEVQQQAVTNWKYVQHEYFRPEYQSIPRVWERKVRQIESVRLVTAPP